MNISALDLLPKCPPFVSFGELEYERRLAVFLMAVDLRADRQALSDLRPFSSSCDNAFKQALDAEIALERYICGDVG